MTNPSNLTIINSGLDVILSWTAGTGVDGYSIYRNGMFIGVTNTTSFVDNTLSPGVYYTWSIICFGSCGNGTPITASGTSPCVSPDNVSGITATQISPTQIYVTWTAVINATGYSLQKSVNGGAWSNLSSTGTSFLDIVTPGSTYQYRVYSYNNCANGNTETSSTITVVCPTMAGPIAGLVILPISETQIQISFDELLDAEGSPAANYIIQRRLGSGGPYSTIDTITYAELPYIDTVESGTQYCYQIQATGGVCLSSAFCPEQCVTTYLPLMCNSPDTVFNWEVPIFGEPGWQLGAGPPSSGPDLHISPSGSIGLSDPRILGIQFGPASVLDDILVLMQDTATVTQVWDGITYDAYTYILPTPCILFANTTGYYNNPTSGSHIGPSTKKTFVQGSKSVVLPNGNNDISSLSFDGSGNITLGITGFRGGSCTGLNGTYTLTKISSTQYTDLVSGWSLSKFGSIWGIYKNTTLMYEADAIANPSIPTNENQWKRPSGITFTALGCQNSTGPNGMGIQDLINAGFIVRNFATGVSKADLISMGFLNDLGVMNFRFAHICCGAGNIKISNLTCSTISCVSDQSPSSLTVTTGACNSVTLTWTDNSGGTASTIIEACSSIDGTWTTITTVAPGIVTYTYTATSNSYTYRSRTMDSCSSNYAYATVPQFCSNVPPSTIEISFNNIVACGCYPGQYSGSITSYTDLSGPYTLTGNGITQSWTGSFGTGEVSCHTSTDCTDVDPTISSGPINISVSISGSTLTISATYTVTCCYSNQMAFHSVTTIPYSSGLFVVNNQILAQSNCTCSGDNSYGGSATVSIGCSQECNCCDGYTVVLSGVTGPHSPNGTFALTQSGCIWSDGQYSLITNVSGKWQLTLGNVYGTVVWQVCHQCPVDSGWTLISNSFSGSPALSITNSGCVNNCSGQVIQMGTSGSFVAPCSGQLGMWFNDCIGSFGDNCNGYTVTINSVPYTVNAYQAGSYNGAGDGSYPNIGPTLTEGETYTYTSTGTSCWHNAASMPTCDCTGNCYFDADGNGPCTPASCGTNLFTGTDTFSNPIILFSLVGKILNYGSITLILCIDSYDFIHLKGNSLWIVNEDYDGNLPGRYDDCTYPSTGTKIHINGSIDWTPTWGALGSYEHISSIYTMPSSMGTSTNINVTGSGFSVYQQPSSGNGYESIISIYESTPTVCEVIISWY